MTGHIRRTSAILLGLFALLLAAGVAMPARAGDNARHGRGRRRGGPGRRSGTGAALDPRNLLKSEELIQQLTAEDIRDAARRYIWFDNYVQVTLMPEQPKP